MLEQQFYLRILFIALFGILFVNVMIKLAKRKSIEEVPQKHIWMKIIAGLFLVSGLLSLVIGIIALTQITFPTTMLEQPITKNMIVRSSDTTQHWGYPTLIQNQVLSFITSFFSCLSIAAYFACFKKSGTRWWQKVLKVIYVILLWLFYVSSTDWHYFDIYEFIATILFCGLAVIPFVLNNKNREGINSQSNALFDSKTETIEPLPNNVSFLSVKSEDKLDQNVSPEHQPRKKERHRNTFNFSDILNSFRSALIGTWEWLKNHSKRVGIVAGCVGALLLCLIVFLAISLSHCPSFVSRFGDKLKYVLHCSNDDLARQLIDESYTNRHSGDFFILFNDGTPAIADSAYVYNKLDDEDLENATVQVMDGEYNVTFPANPGMIQSVYFMVDAGSCTVFYKSAKKELYDRFSKQGIHREDFSIRECRQFVESCYTRALEIPTKNIGTTKKIADYFIERENYNKAIRAYQVSLSINKKNPELLGLLAFAHYQNKDTEDAEVYANKALKYNDTETNALTTLSVLSAQHENWNDALKWSKKAIDYGTELPEAFFVYSASLYNHGEKGQAHNYYNKAFNMDAYCPLAKKYSKYGGCPLEINDLLFSFTDSNGDTVTDFGETLYSSKSQYVTTKMEATSFRRGVYTFDIKFYENGILSTGDTNAKDGYTYNHTVRIREVGDTSLLLGGWGSNVRGCWDRGRYRIEVWYEGELIGSKRFEIK